MNSDIRWRVAGVPHLLEGVERIKEEEVNTRDIAEELNFFFFFFFGQGWQPMLATVSIWAGGVCE